MLFRIKRCWNSKYSLLNLTLPLTYMGVPLDEGCPIKIVSVLENCLQEQFLCQLTTTAVTDRLQQWVDQGHSFQHSHSKRAEGKIAPSTLNKGPQITDCEGDVRLRVGKTVNSAKRHSLVDSRPAPCFLWKWKVHGRVYNNPTMDHILHFMNPVT
jgi:hypothetical protein